MKRRDWLVSASFLSAGVLMIVLGVMRGEPQTVLEKAIKICLECMGIG